MSNFNLTSKSIIDTLLKYKNVIILIKTTIKTSEKFWFTIHRSITIASNNNYYSNFYSNYKKALLQHFLQQISWKPLL